MSETVHTGADTDAPPVHLKIIDPAYVGSGRDGDPWVMTSWDVVECSCRTPWQHAHGTA